jgi:hypothetical protein
MGPLRAIADRTTTLPWFFSTNALGGDDLLRPSDAVFSPVP